MDDENCKGLYFFFNFKFYQMPEFQTLKVRIDIYIIFYIRHLLDCRENYLKCLIKGNRFQPIHYTFLGYFSEGMKDTTNSGPLQLMRFHLHEEKLFSI